LALAGVITWFGYSSFKDITDSAKRRLEPIISDAEKRTAEAQKQIKNTADEVKITKAQIDSLSDKAARQKTRLDSQSGEASQKLAELQKAANNADTLAKGYEDKLNASIHRLDVQSARVERAVDNQAIATNYPTIDTEPYAVIGNKTLDKKQKKPGDAWVQIHLTAFALNHQIISGAKLNDLLAALGQRGFTPFLCTPQVNGRVSGAFEQFGSTNYYQSAVVYFDPSFKTKADLLAKIVGKYIPIASSDAQLVTLPEKPTYSESIIETFLAKSGIDAQIFISASQN
jgi:F0F1-type ATP synthase membrane subunit b/b'